MMAQNSENEMKIWFQKVFDEVIGDITADESVISKYFSKDYIQYVDGHTIDYQAFVDHMKAQKEAIKSADITIERFVYNNGSATTVHYVNAEKNDGSKIQAKVIAFFKVENDKITLCDELTMILKGSEEDKELGSCR